MESFCSGNLDSSKQFQCILIPECQILLVLHIYIYTVHWHWPLDAPAIEILYTETQGLSFKMQQIPQMEIRWVAIKFVSSLPTRRPQFGALYLAKPKDILSNFPFQLVFISGTIDHPFTKHKLTHLHA